MTQKRAFCHCEERSDEAISTFSTAPLSPVWPRFGLTPTDHDLGIGKFRLLTHAEVAYLIKATAP